VLVVEQGDLLGELQQPVPAPAQDLGADGGMGLDQGELLRGEAPTLEQDLVRHADLAQRRAAAPHAP